MNRNLPSAYYWFEKLSLCIALLLIAASSSAQVYPQIDSAKIDSLERYLNDYHKFTPKTWSKEQALEDIQNGHVFIYFAGKLKIRNGVPCLVCDSCTDESTRVFGFYYHHTGTGGVAPDGMADYNSEVRKFLQHKYGSRWEKKRERIYRKCWKKARK